MSSVRYAALFAIVPVVALIANSGWAVTAVVNALQPYDHREELQNQIEFGLQLDVIDKELRRQIEVKDTLIDELIAGQTTLAEVTSQFMILNRSQPVSAFLVRRDYPGATDEEKTARNVISYATAELSKGCPDRKEEVLAHLEAEFERIRNSPAIATPPSNEH